MTTIAQFRANRSNAKHSTGPRTPEGKQQSAKNSLRHGLNASAETLFAASPADREHYNQLRAQLLEQFLPYGATEELAFEQYAYSTFQALRAQRFESEAQDRWLAAPENQNLFLQMERIVKQGALFERRATKAFKQLQSLQFDRLAGVEVRAELEDVDLPTNISPALPIAKLRQKQLAEEEPLFVGLAIYAGLKQQNGETNPIDSTRIQPIGDNKEREPVIK